MPGKSFQGRFRSKNVPPPPPARRVARSTDWFVEVHDAQLARLLEIEPRAIQLFLILLRESLRHHGRPFVLPSDKLVLMPGLRATQLRLWLHRLEQHKLISVARRSPKPPLIQIP
jgi:hypothetical protein